MKRYYYRDTIKSFCNSSTADVLGQLSHANEFSLEITQKNAWVYQIEFLRSILSPFNGSVFFEYSIPRMGKRVDVILIIQNVIFVLEFKVGDDKFSSQSLDQVFDYALDLKNFHETSQMHLLAPILIATESDVPFQNIATTIHNDNILFPLKANSDSLCQLINSILGFADGELINSNTWESGRYSPTPTIIEAAKALYNGHSVLEISRSDASAINLSKTSNRISAIISQAKNKNQKVICFVTGVPGAGKTLVGLDVATKHIDKEKKLSSVFLSGNGPLVAILKEALARDRVRRANFIGKKERIGEARRDVKVFIQNVHHFRDECLLDELPPFDHVAIFDEAQRAWDHKQTASFMKRKKNVSNFPFSEPEFLISCIDRHDDWGVIICLVGGGQEINTGEAGISEWIHSLNRSFPNWHIYISDRLNDAEYAAGHALELLDAHKNVFKLSDLHLGVSLRSFRAEHLSSLVKNILDIDITQARKSYELVKDKYPIVLTRDLSKAKHWLKENARGSERYGIVVSSQAQRLKPHAIDVKSPIDPIHWFLDEKSDVRSSYYLEDVATEFHIQGLELDWSCVTWDADFRFAGDHWESFSFVGDKWNKIRLESRQQYLKNAYRVLLTRARQGMIIVVPNGDIEDGTRKEEFYNETFEYLKQIGLVEI